jgi:hypothetical protein
MDSPRSLSGTRLVAVNKLSLPPAEAGIANNGFYRLLAALLHILHHLKGNAT